MEIRGSDRPRTRRKGGLETPLVGRFAREGARLVFAPPLWYDALVLACVLGGPAAFLAGRALGWPVFDHPFAGPFAGAGVCLAGVWAALSNERMSCDLRQGTYARLEGQGLAKRLSRGRIDELDAVVVTAEEYPLSMAGRTVVYRIVLHWKGKKEPPLVVGRATARLSSAEPLNAGAGPALQAADRYARALGARLYDNSYFHQPAPIPVL